MRLTRLGIVILALCLSASLANASNLSFSGVFTQDDQFEVFLFSTPSPGATVRTWSYAGGTNANGQLFPAGGFDPVLSLFDASSGLLAGSLLLDSNNDGAGVATDPVTGNEFDSLFVIGVPGTYALVITQNDNIANGPTFGDGFSRSGQGNFTAGENGCATSDPFCESPFVPNRTGQWAVDILGANALTAPAPEPSSILLLVSGIVGLGLLLRRGTQA